MRAPLATLAVLCGAISAAPPRTQHALIAPDDARLLVPPSMAAVAVSLALSACRTEPPSPVPIPPAPVAMDGHAPSTLAQAPVDASVPRRPADPCRIVGKLSAVRHHMAVV